MTFPSAFARSIPVLAGVVLVGVLGAQSPADPQVPSGPVRSGWTGCACGHMCGGRCGCGAFTCPSGRERYESLSRDPVASAALASRIEPAPCTDGVALDLFPCRGIDLLAWIPLAALRPGALTASNLWGFVSRNDQREYAVIGLNNGTSVVDVTDPSAPVVVGSVGGLVSPWREVKVFQPYEPARGRYGAYAYVVSEAVGAGLQILDLSDLPRSISLAGTSDAFSTAHTVSISAVDPATMSPDGGPVKPVLYVQGFDRLQGFNRAGILAFDVSRPTAPALLGAYRRSYGHDTWTSVLTGARAAGCAGHDPCELVVNWSGDAVRLLDFTDKTDPVVLSEYVYPELAYAHSGWVAADGRHVFSMDEIDERVFGGNSRVRVLDISDLRHPRLAATWTSETNAIEHNGYTVGNKYYVSYYEHGLVVLDVTNPEAPRERAFFDTFPAGEGAEFHGAWGVYPFLPSRTILLSNIDGAAGLFLLKEAPTSVDDRIPVVPAPLRPRDPRVLVR